MNVTRKKFLLLFVCAGFLLGSCNIRPNFSSWFFGNKLSGKIVGKNSKSSFGLGKALFCGVLAIGAVFVLCKWLSKKDIDNGQVDEDIKPVDNDNGLNKGIVKKETGVYQILPQGQASAIKKESGIINKNTSSVEPEIKPDNKKENLVEENFAKIAVKQFIDAAKVKEILEKSKVLELQLKNGKKVINNIYKLTVAKQGDASCGPRAIYNCQIMNEIISFDAEKKAFKFDADKLDCLNKVGEKGEEKENPRLLEFFEKMRNACDIRFVCNVNSSGYYYNTNNLAEYSFDEHTGKVNGVDFDKKVVSGFKESEEKIFKDCRFGADNAIQWANYSHMMEFIVNCKKQKNCNFKCDKMMVCSPMNYDMFKLKGHCSEIKLYEESKSVGYRKNFVITPEIIGSKSSFYHYVSVNVIKTGENEYDWFVCDSLYEGALDSKELAGYIVAMTTDI